MDLQPPSNPQPWNVAQQSPWTPEATSQSAQPMGNFSSAPVPTPSPLPSVSPTIEKSRTQIAREYLIAGLSVQEVHKRMISDGLAVDISLIYTARCAMKRKAKDARKAKKEAKHAVTPFPIATRPAINTNAVIKSVKQVLEIQAINEEEQLRLIRKIVG